MRWNVRQLFLVVVVSAIAGVGTFAWGDHGHGFGGGWGHASSGHFGGHVGVYSHWGGGGGHFYSGHSYGWPYRYSAWPSAYRSFGFPYAYGGYFGGYPCSYYGYPTAYYGYPAAYYYGYPAAYYGYPSSYYANDYYSDDAPPQQYVVSRPVLDIARLEVRLPDPQGTIWVEGKEIASTGVVRRFSSPQLDPLQQYNYTVKAEWHDNGKLVTDERKVNVRANASAVVDFNQPSQATPDAQRPALPELPPPQPRPAD